MQLVEKTHYKRRFHFGKREGGNRKEKRMKDGE
jgi:hypothetical protein